MIDWTDDDDRRVRTSLALQEVDMYSELARHSRWTKWDAMWFYWYPFFAAVEILLTILNLLAHHWFTAGMCFVMACAMLVLFRLNGRNKQRKLESQQEWLDKKAEAERKLFALDPASAPKVIDEEPEL